MTRQIVSTSSSATERLAEKLGQQLRGGEVIELVSDLGGGKTTFVRGLARGAGSQDRVASPTFTISKVYQADKFAIHHFDFYRLAGAGLMEHELHDLLGDPRVVTVIEWGGVVQHVLPAERLTIRFSRTSDDTRQLDLTCPQSLQYLVEAL
jgi:tRNA threonylcarbamoyladenosine biosynthesis protein TsaE